MHSTPSTHNINIMLLWTLFAWNVLVSFLGHGNNNVAQLTWKCIRHASSVSYTIIIRITFSHFFSDDPVSANLSLPNFITTKFGRDYYIFHMLKTKYCKFKVYSQKKKNNWLFHFGYCTWKTHIFTVRLVLVTVDYSNLVLTLISSSFSDWYV